MTYAIIRVIGFLIFLVSGFELGVNYGHVQTFETSTLKWLVPLSVVSGIIGAIITPWLTVIPAKHMNRLIKRTSAQELIAATIGMTVGLVMAALLTVPLATLPYPFNRIFPAIAAVVLAYIGIMAAVIRHEDFMELLKKRSFKHRPSAEKEILLDTSVIIDGRIADISKTGFLFGKLLIPRFVLNELQYIADSSDSLRRNRGRRGLEVLKRLQEEGGDRVQIIDDDIPSVHQVDEKLVQLALKRKASVMTNDYNLNRVAALQGVEVLNINDLANAVKTVVLPGERLRINIIQEGKESGQGVGFLDDGTMVVVENGKRYIGSTVDVVVTKVLQTSAGRMIFAQVPKNKN